MNDELGRFDLKECADALSEAINRAMEDVKQPKFSELNGDRKLMVYTGGEFAYTLGLTADVLTKEELLKELCNGGKDAKDKVAELAGEPFLSHYMKLNELLFGPKDGFHFREFDRITERMVLTGAVSPHVVEFCLQSDCEGFITWKTCRKLLKIIGDYDDEAAYGYAARPNSGFKAFKSILEDCVKHKCSMRWS